ncbi:ABC transporter permease [Gaetbulibacter aestuarii]|uniref:ABC transporter permease n=1 Tax=Gaetbulibacter aestuarii TaxID=1502358 RepID=A0ABW7N2A9_9FLAO
MNHLPLIIKREYLTKVRNKSFIVMTILSPLIFVALIAVISYLTQLNKDKVRVINILDPSGVVHNTFKSSENTRYAVLDNMSLKEAKTLSKKTESFGLLYVDDQMTDGSIPKIKFFSDESPSLSLINDLENKLDKTFTDRNLKDKGINVDTIENSQVRINIFQESFEGEKTSKMDSLVKLIFGGAAGYLLFMFIIIYGNLIMRSVIEEKTSRIIEVIISSVKPLQLMLGKIIGTSLAGLTQFAIWILFGGILLTVTSVIFGIDLSQIESPQKAVVDQMVASPDFNAKVEGFMTAFYHLPLANLIIAFIFFFIAGYLLYSSLYAAIGAAVDNETDTQQFMLPIIMPLMLAVYIGFFTVIEDPHGTVSTVFSFIPFTSPIVMLMRIPFGVPIWHQIVSLLILLGTFMLIVWFAAKIYRVGILMYGKKPSWKEIIKWVKY